MPAAASVSALSVTVSCRFHIVDVKKIPQITSILVYIAFGDIVVYIRHRINVHEPAAAVLECPRHFPLFCIVHIVRSAYVSHVRLGEKGRVGRPVYAKAVLYLVLYFFAVVLWLYKQLCAVRDARTT